jgi:hypothetical protein
MFRCMAIWALPPLLSLPELQLYDNTVDLMQQFAHAFGANPPSLTNSAHYSSRASQLGLGNLFNLFFLGGGALLF